jgi:CBS domain-containing protein
MKVKDIIEGKGSHVVSVSHKTTIYKAIEQLAANKVGSLLVLNDDNVIVGIVGAVDILKAVHRACDQIKTKPLKEIMTSEIIVCSPEDDLEDIKNIMTFSRIRHIPVISGKTLAGIISIGDVVKAQLTEKHVENRYLREYISGPFVE